MIESSAIQELNWTIIPDVLTKRNLIRNTVTEMLQETTMFYSDIKLLFFLLFVSGVRGEYIFVMVCSCLGRECILSLTMHANSHFTHTINLSKVTWNTLLLYLWVVGFQIILQETNESGAFVSTNLFSILQEIAWTKMLCKFSLISEELTRIIK